MIYLIDYDRSAGHLANMRVFADAASREAEDARLELELQQWHSGLSHEVVLLEAANEEQLRRTHARYFKSLAELASSLEAIELVHPC